MTQRRNDPDRLSNYFDRLLSGIGHRGSSFSDIDACTHDGATDRFLYQEFKRQAEKINRGQADLLKALARRDYNTVWCVRPRADADLDWYNVRTRKLEVISVKEYRELVRRWWRSDEGAPQNTWESAPVTPDVTEINW
jgi:hypothetical protein